jgi:hypothetical protein
MKKINPTINPLTVLLGHVFQKERGTLSLTNEEVANELKVQPSYYRAVEAGNYGLHASNAFMLPKVFPRFSYSSLALLLTTISVTNQYITDVQAYKDVLSVVFENDEFLYFREIAEDIANSAGKSRIEMKDVICSDKAYQIAVKFLTGFQYSKISPEDGLYLRMTKALKARPILFPVFEALLKMDV